MAKEKDKEIDKDKMLDQVLADIEKQFGKGAIMKLGGQNNVETLLSELERLHRYYEQQPLPVTRQEFENRSMLYHILEDMKAFLDIKKDFITAR